MVFRSFMIDPLGAMKGLYNYIQTRPSPGLWSELSSLLAQILQQFCGFFLRFPVLFRKFLFALVIFWAFWKDLSLPFLREKIRAEEAGRTQRTLI